ncbi:tRNA acetyltransferase TAN1 [Podospora fimiseda]|uniref:tRNA acetyltransferase TAN1 n=1 Tax=Podospora fimiseda TaxID=252190 RepID=A0AAN7BRJ3_9PEZI|nr:tRNA acetyltransferase TAN1 [Podospora fimiseda]
MGENGKRKNAPSGGAAQQAKKKKSGGNGGKWQTPHQQAKAVKHQESSLVPGEPGIWVTCARHQENRAAREVALLFAEVRFCTCIHACMQVYNIVLTIMCYQYGEKMYGIKSVHDDAATKKDGDSDDDGDIEAAIQKEVAALNANRKGTDGGHNWTPLKMNVDCLLFVKTKAPVEPTAFVRRICEDAKKSSTENLQMMKCRYVNRLTPVTVTGKATEQGLADVAKEALSPFFDLTEKREAAEEGDNEKDDEAAAEAKAGDEDKSESEKKGFTFAIRPSIRNHSKLKRDVVINTIAGMVNSDRHKVNLSSPDKVILVDVYQTVCGISVVDGDWDELKRYNLTELYGQAKLKSGGGNDEKAKEEGTGTESK